MPAQAGRLRPLERCVFVVVFTLMATCVVGVAFLATTYRGNLLLTGPSVAQRTIAAEMHAPQAMLGPGRLPSAERSRASSRGDRAGHGTHVLLPAELDAHLAAALGPMLGADPGRLAVGVIDLSTGATATFDAGVQIRAGGVVAADILAALLLQHQQAGTAVTVHEAELAADMIENGSSSAADELWAIVGGEPGITAANMTLKLRHTILAPGADWTWTKTTVTDQLQLLADLTQPGSPLDVAARDYALGLMADAGTSQRWGVLAAASTRNTGAVTNGSLVGPMWVIGSIGVIQRNGHELLVAVLSDRNTAEQSAVAAAEKAAVTAASVVG